MSEVALRDDTSLIQKVVVGNIIDPGRLAASLNLNKAQLAQAIGVPADTLRRTTRAHSKATQARLRDVIELLDRTTPWSGGLQQSWAWYRSEGLPSFGELTAEDLTKEGHAEAVKTYLSRIAEGGYA